MNDNELIGDDFFDDISKEELIKAYTRLNRLVEIYEHVIFQHIFWLKERGTKSTYELRNLKDNIIDFFSLINSGSHLDLPRGFRFEWDNYEIDIFPYMSVLKKILDDVAGKDWLHAD